MRFVLLLAAAFLGAANSVNAAQVYILGHADIGVGFEGGGLDLHFHAEEDIGLANGGTAPAGEYGPGEIIIGVPGPSIDRPAGNQWSFLAPNAGDSVWFLPQSSDANKPFLGLATEELETGDGWNSPITWTLNSINTLWGDDSAFAIWQEQLGTPTVFASTLDPTNDNSWEQSTEGHEHYNIGFTGEGLYEVSFTVSGFNSDLDETFFDTASFRFATGSAITAIPEPSHFAVLGIVAFGIVHVTRKRQNRVTFNA